MDIFEAVSNEIRRKIIKLLQTPRSFSELCERLNLESSALAFHLKKLDGLITKDDKGNYVLTELGKKALSIVNMIESQNVILPEEKRVLTPVLIEYADKVIIDKGMLTKIKEENKKLIIRNVNEVIFKDDIDENLLNGVLELIENVITIKSPPNLKDIISRKSK
ncbi:transcriptional regulator, partial [Sulfolobus sp. F3]